MPEPGVLEWAGGINVGIISVDRALYHKLGEMSKGASINSRASGSFIFSIWKEKEESKQKKKCLHLLLPLIFFAISEI